MRQTLSNFLPDVRVTPDRAAAFGAAIGGLAAIALYSVLGDLVADLAAPMPAYAVVVIAEVAGAAIAWTKVRRR